VPLQASRTLGKKVTLFVGSNRQSSEIDNFNNGDNQNGLALGMNGAFERWAEQKQDKRLVTEQGLAV